MDSKQQFEKHYRPTMFWLIAGAAIIMGIYLLRPFMAAIAWAIVLSVLTHPFYKRFRQKYNESVSATFTVLGSLVVIVVPLILIGLMLVTTFSGYVTDYQTSLSHDSPKVSSEIAPPDENPEDISKAIKPIAAQIQPIVDKAGVDFKVMPWFEKNKEEIGKRLSSAVPQVVGTFGFGVFTMVVALLTMFFMVRDGHRLLRPTLELLPFPMESGQRLITKMGETMRSVFVAIVVVSLVQATIAGLAYWICGVSSPFVFALATFVFCVIPLLGGPVVYVPLSLFLLAQGKTWQGLLLLGIGVGIVSQVDNFLRPYIIGTQSKMHYMGIFFSLLGGVLTFGPVGLMMGPVLLTVLVGLQEAIREARGFNVTSDEGAPEPA